MQPVKLGMELPASLSEAEELRPLAERIFAAATYRDGVLGQAPRLERFAIHKLIAANRPGPMICATPLRKLSHAESANASRLRSSEHRHP